MQIVAMDADELADGSGTAPLTFIGMELLATKRNYNLGSSANRWKDCGLRSVLKTTIYDLIPTNIKSRINAVNKTYTVSKASPTKWNPSETTSDTVWIPSAREMTGSTYETSGVAYNVLYNSNESRIKTRGGNAERYATRSIYDFGSVSAIAVSDGGAISTGSGTGRSALYGVALGFCLGLEPETITDDWETILANSSPSASYSIGDTKYLDLGTEGKHLMEIVGIDVDDRADGQGKAGLTWISKTLLNTRHKMNDTATTEGGWEVTSMRAYLKNTIKPLIPAEVRNAIVNVTKISSIVTNGTMVKDGQTTTDDVWIPSAYEVGSSNSYESIGPVYTMKFNSATNRIKEQNHSAINWWIRSASSTVDFCRINTGGYDSVIDANKVQGIALGFCTN